jgi:hypothetical protein
MMYKELQKVNSQQRGLHWKLFHSLGPLQSVQTENKLFQIQSLYSLGSFWIGLFFAQLQYPLVQSFI